MNILFVMYDQLRFDYLSCAGHPHLQTPNFDRVAAQGMRFTNAYVQSPICGASRMSYYTGRYVASHGAAWNNFPLRVGFPMRLFFCWWSQKRSKLSLSGFPASRARPINVRVQD